jgi:flavin reductase (DIM6/NTAB) family NADH-FMN oxidoreductase RutF
MNKISSAAVQAALPIHKYFASTVTLITSHSEIHGANIMACEWVMNISYRPLKILAVINQSDLTHEIILASREFGVNLCSDNQATLSHLAGISSGRDCDKLALPHFAQAAYPAAHIRTTMIQGCVLNAECVVEQAIPMGDYTGFVGRAVAARANKKLHPLLYHKGMYFSIGNRIPKTTEHIGVDGTTLK